MSFKLSEIEIIAGLPQLNYGFWIGDNKDNRIMGIIYKDAEEADRSKSRLQMVLGRAHLVLDANGKNHSSLAPETWEWMSTGPYPSRPIGAPEDNQSGYHGFSVIDEAGNVIVTLAYGPEDWGPRKNEASGRKMQMEALLSAAAFVVDMNGKTHSRVSCQWGHPPASPEQGLLQSN